MLVLVVESVVWHRRVNLLHSGVLGNVVIIIIGANLPMKVLLLVPLVALLENLIVAFVLILVGGDALSSSLVGLVDCAVGSVGVAVHDGSLRRGSAEGSLLVLRHYYNYLKIQKEL